MDQIDPSTLDFINAPPAEQRSDFADAVRQGLSLPRKTLPPRFLYDARGSELFEAITRLPEYYLTRCEQSIFEAYAPQIVSSVGLEAISIVELGSGSSYKTRLLIEAALQRQERLHYLPIDISEGFLRETALKLLNAYPALRITAIAAEYHEGVRRLPLRDPQSDDAPRLALFLGSNIGNFDYEGAIDLMSLLRSQMRSSDRALIGIDRVKTVSVIESAYNDAQGVTAQFNFNLLERINRELGGHFDLNAFRHAAPFVAGESRIEMRLISLKDQRVAIDTLDASFEFAEGEYIHTENSYKYTLEAFDELCAESGWEIERSWHDENEWFSEMLLKPVKR